MAKEIVSDELAALIQPLLSPPPPRPKGGDRPSHPGPKGAHRDFVGVDDGHSSGDVTQRDWAVAVAGPLTETEALAAGGSREALAPGAAGPAWRSG